MSGWRWTAHARRRHYFKGQLGTTVTSLCGEHSSRLNGMEQQDAGPDDCAVCTKKISKGDRK